MSNCWVEIDLKAISNNFSFIKKIVSPSKVCAVIKADAYGHGAVPIAKALNADMFGVFSLDEGVILRNGGVDKPILILGPSMEEEVFDIVQYNLIPNVFTKEFLIALSKIPSKVKCHIKVDTGMGRIGISFDNAIEFIKEAVSYSNIDVEGIFSHLATSYLKDKSYALEQFRKFSYLIEQLKCIGIEIPIKHIANSAAILSLPEMNLSMVRPGILLYGLMPSDDMEKVPVKPAMSFKTRLVSVRRFPKGSGISYGKTYVTKKDSIIGVIPVGYTHGLRRNLSNKGYVLVGGKRVKIVGTLCMDMTMIDLSDILDISIGDEVVIFGTQDNETISVDEIAKFCETINYEIITGINPKIPRVYI
ncbi:TPA: alanine racemase [bacterium]|nr:alanine racemase [bacterium]